MPEIKNKNNALAVYAHLKKEAELPRNAIVAIMANIAIETGGTFDYKTEQKGRTKPAYGLFQFDPIGGLFDLYREYLEWAKAEDSMEAQLNMMTDIFLMAWPRGVAYIGKGNVAKTVSAAEKSAEDCAVAFSGFILRPGKPHIERRKAACAEVDALCTEQDLRNAIDGVH